MKLQIAVDRVSLNNAVTMAETVRDHVDIFEIGTSLIKDYGMDAIRKIREVLPQVTIFADLKTMDEGAYEFDAAYKAGADIASVMGAASVATISACCESAKRSKRDVLIDLLEVNDNKIDLLAPFTDRLLCVHPSVDATGTGENGNGLEQKLGFFTNRYKNVNRIAVAGGVLIETLPSLMQYPLEVIIVGSAITKADDVRAAARAYFNAIHKRA